jgi:hypothetical protein
VDELEGTKQVQYAIDSNMVKMTAVLLKKLLYTVGGQGLFRLIQDIKNLPARFGYFITIAA